MSLRYRSQHCLSRCDLLVALRSDTSRMKYVLWKRRQRTARTHQSGTVRYLNSRVDLLQSLARFGFAGLPQFVLSVDPLLRLISRLDHYLLFLRTAGKHGAGDGDEPNIFDFHYFKYAIAEGSGCMSTASSDAFRTPGTAAPALEPPLHSTAEHDRDRNNHQFPHRQRVARLKLIKQAIGKHHK